MNKEIIWEEEFQDERQDSIWHSNRIVTIKCGKYIVYVGAVGDVSIKLEGELFKDKNDDGYIGKVLKEHNITNDSQLKEAIDSGKLTILDNNWYEYWLYDTEKQDYVAGDIIDDEISKKDDFAWVDDVITWYEESEEEDQTNERPWDYTAHFE